MAPAQGAAVREKDPVNRLFNRVAYADASQIDGPAIRTACREHSQAPVLAALPVDVAEALPEAATLG